MPIAKPYYRDPLVLDSEVPCQGKITDFLSGPFQSLAVRFPVLDWPTGQPASQPAGRPASLPAGRPAGRLAGRPAGQPAGSFLVLSGPC